MHQRLRSTVFGAIVALLFTTAAAAQCPGGGGNCYAANGSPGCGSTLCCLLVCAIDPFCCQNDWDAICAETALANCGGCGLPTSGSCFMPNGSSGCTNAKKFSSSPRGAKN